MLDKVPSSMGEEGRTSEHVWHISSLKHPFLPPFIMEWEPEKGSTAAPLCLKGSSCVLFSLKGSGWRVLRNRLYRSVLNWKWEEAWDKWLMGVKVIGKKTQFNGFFLFQAVLTDHSAVLVPSSQVPFLSHLVPTGIIPSQEVCTSSKVPRSASVAAMNSVCTGELNLSLSRLLKRDARDKGVTNEENQPFKKEILKIKNVHSGQSLGGGSFQSSDGACSPAHFPNKSFKPKAGSQMVLMSWSLRYTGMWTKIV